MQGRLALALCLGSSPALAYTAVGDRTFTANLLIPQIAQSDAFWATLSSARSSDTGQRQLLSGTYAKMITERSGIEIGYGGVHDHGVTGATNLSLLAEYQAVLDPEREFELTVSLDHEFGHTGTSRTGAQSQGATRPALAFGKGLGALSLPWVRPLAVVGYAGYQFGEGSRYNQLSLGLGLQYSLPYLTSNTTSR